MTQKPFTIFDAATGAAKRYGYTTAQNWDSECQPGEVIRETIAPNAYLSGQTLLAIPEKPSPFHTWDKVAREWTPDLEAAKTAKRKAIEAERDARIYAPVVVYDGKNLDADAVSLDRLAKKLTTTGIQLENGDTPDQMTLVWRDADNLTHYFVDLATYHEWLKGFALAVDARGMQAFAWSWAKKAELDGAETVEQVEAIEL